MFWTMSFFVMPAPVQARAITSVHSSTSFRVYPTTTIFPVVPDVAWNSTMSSLAAVKRPNG